MTRELLYLIEFPEHGPRLVAQIHARAVESGLLLAFRDAERQSGDLFVTGREPAGDGVWIIESPSLGRGVIRPASDSDLERIVLGRPARDDSEALLGLREPL